MADNFVKVDTKDVFFDGTDLIGDARRSIVAEIDKQISDEIAEVIQKHFPGATCDGEKVLRFARLLKAQGVPDMVEVVRCKEGAGMKLKELLNVIDNCEKCLVWDDDKPIDVPPLFEEGLVCDCKKREDLANCEVAFIIPIKSRLDIFIKKENGKEGE